MKYLLKNQGILMIIAAVVILSVYAVKNFIDNIYLIISLLLLLSGIITHIIVNRKVEE
jgi:intracellular septation protein A